MNGRDRDGVKDIKGMEKKKRNRKGVKEETIHG